MYAEDTEILKNPEFIEKQGTARGMSIVENSPEEFSKRIADDVRLTDGMARAARIERQ